jgi:hypothetical protein
MGNAHWSNNKFAEEEEEEVGEASNAGFDRLLNFFR